MPHASRRRPTLTITAGPISSGKSEWVRSFREKVGGPTCLIRDEMRLHIGGEGYLDGPVDHNVEEVVTRRVREQARNVLACGIDVYVDGSHNHPRTRKQWEALATEVGADFRLMFFDCALGEIIDLNTRRRAPHSREEIESSYWQWDEWFRRLAARPQHRFVSAERSQE